MKAYLILEDGNVFEGESVGADKEVVSEFVFNTSMTGYVEVLTDLTGDELESLDPYGAELVTYGICYETLSNSIHKLAEILNEKYS